MGLPGFQMGLQSSMFHLEMHSCYIIPQLGEVVEDNGKDKCFLDQLCIYVIIIIILIYILLLCYNVPIYI